MYRSGTGYDVHRFATGRPLVLAGVSVPYSHGLQAHSDGDVAIHALCDALLGAAGLGDIGQHFPDSDPALALIDSRILLRRVSELLARDEFVTVNVDLTIVAERPKLAAYVPDMCRILSADLGIDVDRVNVKATTTEGLGFTGRGEGIATYAVALIRSVNAIASES